MAKWLDNRPYICIPFLREFGFDSQQKLKSQALLQSIVNMTMIHIMLMALQYLCLIPRLLICNLLVMQLNSRS